MAADVVSVTVMLALVYVIVRLTIEEQGARDAAGYIIGLVLVVVAALGLACAAARVDQLIQDLW